MSSFWGAVSKVRRVVGRREGDICIIWKEVAATAPLSDEEPKGKNTVYTLTIPPVPHPTAITSPQYRSLHQEIHHPPSASLFPNPGLPVPVPCMD